MLQYEYIVLRKDSADEMMRAMNKFKVQGWKNTYFKYHEYACNVKGEGMTIMQSYVAVMEHTHNEFKLPEKVDITT